ncbi:MAG: DinB family protein [Acidobacteria bacterium]|nr:DinB family protein [Acidobacteriota bacterium]
MRHFVLWAIIAGIGTHVGFAADPITDELRRQWEASRNQIVRLAEAIPEDKYDYKPTPEVRSFREQLQHLIGENHMFMGMVAGGGSAAPQTQNLKTRTEILKALSESYDYGTKVLAGLNDQKAVEIIAGFRGQRMPRFGIVISNMKDNHEHYGNLVTYLRLNGIVPPRTAGAQQRPGT